MTSSLNLLPFVCRRSPLAGKCSNRLSRHRHLTRHLSLRRPSTRSSRVTAIISDYPSRYNGPQSTSACAQQKRTSSPVAVLSLSLVLASCSPQRCGAMPNRPRTYHKLPECKIRQSGTLTGKCSCRLCQSVQLCELQHIVLFPVPLSRSGIQHSGSGQGEACRPALVRSCSTRRHQSRLGQHGEQVMHNFMSASLHGKGQGRSRDRVNAKQRDAPLSVSFVCSKCNCHWFVRTS